MRQQNCQLSINLQSNHLIGHPTNHQPANQRMSSPPLSNQIVSQSSKANCDNNKSEIRKNGHVVHFTAVSPSQRREQMSPSNRRREMSSSRSVDSLVSAVKPPVPSREAVNRKLLINGGTTAAPPPPPRGDSLIKPPSKFISQTTVCDTTSSSNHLSKSMDKLYVKGHEFDSGRESDETFDNESIKSESTDLSASPLQSTPTSPYSGSDVLTYRSNIVEESVVQLDNKTKVTFWTDTYL